jgi:predicted MPP superfamily phosphohydrolase
VRFGDSRLNLVGVDHEFFPPYLVGMKELVAPDEFNVLLAHTPEVFETAQTHGFQLTLSGHTHGGQINLEVAGKNYNLVALDTPYTKGLYRRGASAIYVNSGLGTIGIPARIGAPPEISVIRLCNS